MAGSRGAWLVLLALGVLVAVHPTGGCHVDGTEAPAGAGVLLADVGPEVVRPALTAFDGALSDLEVAVLAWADAMGTPEAEAALGSARLSFADTALAWQALEVMQVGPAASSRTDPGGRDLRDVVYSWPTVNACLVDQLTVHRDWERTDFFEVNLVNAYGLDALEHLLYAGPANACPGQVDINAEGTWTGLGADAVAAYRADFAVVLMEGLADTTATLVDAWSPDGGDFGAQLAGGEGSVYASEREALHAVFDAMLYLETVTKDRKLAAPLDCSSPTCAELVEGLASGSSTQWVAANLRGFRTLFTGGAGRGFDDLLADLGHADLAQRVLAHTDVALGLADGAIMTVDESMAVNRAEAQALLEAVKQVTDDLKGDVATLLSLRLPSEAAGDND